MLIQPLSRGQIHTKHFKERQRWKHCLQADFKDLGEAGATLTAAARSEIQEETPPQTAVGMKSKEGGSLGFAAVCMKTEM